MTFIRILFTYILFVGFADFVNGNNVRYFRSDYPLIEDMKAFYKYHEQQKSWYQAKETCENEGAVLFDPENEDHLDKLLPLGIKSDVHVGSSSKVNQSTEECPYLEDFSNKNKKIRHDCGKTATFLCQKTQASVQWNDDCNMPVLARDGYDYEYDSKLKKCYKLHTAPRTWYKAYEVCKAEQSSLTELNSQEEADHLVNIVKKVPEETVGVVCLGFQKDSHKRWKMLSGGLLRESGYPMWAHTQPDGGEFESFGAMAYNGRLHDIGGKAHCIFICERYVKKTS